MSGEKERINVTVDPDVLEELDEWSDNRSAVVNELLREYVASGGDGPVGLEIKLQHTEKKLNDAMDKRDRVNRRIERLRDQKDRLEREINARTEERRDRLREAKKYVEGRDPSNPAVQNWAEKLNMQPTELLRKVEEVEA